MNYIIIVKYFFVSIFSWQLFISGKMFKTAELPYLVQFFQMFFNDKPVDWLLDHLISTKFCNWDKNNVSSSSSLDSNFWMVFMITRTAHFPSWKSSHLQPFILLFELPRRRINEVLYGFSHFVIDSKNGWVKQMFLDLSWLHNEINLDHLRLTATFSFLALFIHINENISVITSF